VEKPMQQAAAGKRTRRRKQLGGEAAGETVRSTAKTSLSWGAGAKAKAAAQKKQRLTIS
jgi:hypothetical protein